MNLDKFHQWDLYSRHTFSNKSGLPLETLQQTVPV